MSLKPLRITWEFASPVVARTFPLHLDALLAWAKVNRAQLMGEPNPFDAQLDLPLEKVNGVWKASQLVFAPAGDPFFFPFIRKASLADFAHDRGRRYAAGNKNSFALGSGGYKAFDVRQQAQQMYQATAWCVGDKEKIEDLLQDVTSIGKWHNKGQGKIRSSGHKLFTTVQECDHGEEENWRLRVLPFDSGLESPDIEYAEVMAVCTVPYWDRTQTRRALMPLANP